MTLEFDTYLGHLEANVARFDAVIAPIDPTAPVPSCPDWAVGDLRDHMAGVLAFWRAQLGADGSLDGPFFPPDLSEQAALPASALAGEVATIFTAVGSDQDCWNWSGVDQKTSWVARRMAQESAIHRVDAELAAGVPTPIDATLAVDGINELIDVFVDAAPDVDLDGATMVQFTATDTGHEWHVALTDEGVLRCSSTPGAQLSGSAGGILQALWSRPGDARWSGDPAAPTRWRALASFE